MAEADFKYDVFISYSHKDEEWVRNILLPTLEKQGLKVCIDYRDFIAGKPAIINMADASETSRHTLLVLTPRWVESEWTLYESILSRTDDPSGLQRRTIPLLLEKCKPPKFISMLSWVDFTDKKRESEAWQNLFKSLDKEVEKVEVEKGTADKWYLAHPYPMLPNFTGRAAEQKMLDNWLADDKDRLFILRALGGFGKSALAWQWINTHVDPAEWTRLVWWSFYEGDASFEHFIEETLKYLKLEVPQGQRTQVDELLKAMQSQKILLIMDGFERALRAYSSMNAPYQGDEEPKLEENQLDCMNINAEIFLKNVCSLPSMKGKVLMTTRLPPRAVKPHGEFMLGCREEVLRAMQKADAVEFFRKQKIKGTHAEIEAACAPYGYHSLSLRLLAGLIVSDLQIPGDIAVAKRLDISKDIVQNKHHVLEQTYSAMPKERQKLLSQIACFRSPVTYDTLKSILPVDVTSEAAKATKKKVRISKSRLPKAKKAVQYKDFDNGLRDLLARGLLHHDTKTNYYDLHPIVRRFAYDRLTATNRRIAHNRLVNYFEAIPEPEKIEKLEDIAPVIELYHHMVRARKLYEAFVLYQDGLADTLYFQLASYQIIVELLVALFPERDDKPPALRKEWDQAWTLNALGAAYDRVGQPHSSIKKREMSIVLDQKLDDEKNLAIDLGNLAQPQLDIGALKEAERNLHRRIELCRKIKDERSEAIGHQELGHLISYLGAWAEAKQELDLSFNYDTTQNDYQGLSVDWSYRALRFLLMARSNPQLKVSNLKSAIKSASRALESADDTAEKIFLHLPDYVRAYWLLGTTHRANSDLIKAEENLSKAISMSRQINYVEEEANILLDLARLRYDQKNYEEAKSLADEALLITERCGYVLQGADVNLFLAQYALEQEKDKAKAKEYAETALKLATCDGPPYYYKVAYEEAERMLEKLA